MHVKERPYGAHADRSMQKYEAFMIEAIQRHPALRQCFVHAFVSNNAVFSEKYAWDGHDFITHCVQYKGELVNFYVAVYTLLDLVHGLGLIHGDCKINNVLVTPLQRAAEAGEVTFLHKGVLLKVVFCDCESAFWYYNRTWDKARDMVSLGRTWYGWRSAAATRANFDNAKASDVYSLTASLCSTVKYYDVRSCLCALISNVVHTLKDPRPNYGNDTFFCYVPDCTKDWGVASASEALDAFRRFEVNG